MFFKVVTLLWTDLFTDDLRWLSAFSQNKKG